MTDQRSDDRLGGRAQRSGRLLAFVLCVFALSVTASGLWRVTTDAGQALGSLATANPESSQWSLSQSEVEVLKLVNALLVARSGQADDLDEVRRRFNILYARVQLIKSGEIFSSVRAKPAVATAIDAIGSELDRFIPAIDGDDDALLAAIDELSKASAEITQALRFVSVEGVSTFSQRSVERRAALSVVLSELTLFASAFGLLILAVLAALIWQLFRLHRSQTEVAEAEDRLRTVIETALDAVVVVGAKGRILEVNKAASTMFGFDPEFALGKPFATLFACHQLMAQAGTPPLFDMDGLVQRQAVDRTGREFPAEVSVSRAQSTNGDIYVAFLRDISDRIDAEQEILSARDKALAGERAKADLLAVMSHEMRTPVNGIMGGLEVLSETGLNDHQGKLLDAMQTSAALLLRHVNAGLDIARFDAGAIIVSEEEFAIMDLVEAAIASLQAQAHVRGNNLKTVEVSDGLGLSIGDPGCLMQILINLVGNAIKFTRKGQITVEVERLPGSETVEFRVIDTGMGVAEGDLGRIFEDFVTVDTSYSRDVEGTGLGLPIVKRLVTGMDGELGVESEVGAGSAFWIRLPLPLADPNNSSFQKDYADAGGHPGQGKSVLLVEDNEINRLVAREMLTALGFIVVEAVDGERGVAEAQKTAFDFVLMDISMPKLNGIDATKAIRSTAGPNQKTPIIGLTAYAAPDEIARFKQAGMRQVVVKPASKARLLQALLGADPREPTPSQADRTMGGELLQVLGADLADELTTKARREVVSQIDRVLAGEIPDYEIPSVLHQLIGLASVVGYSDIADCLRDAKRSAGLDRPADLQQALEQARSAASTHAR